MEKLKMIKLEFTKEELNLILVHLELAQFHFSEKIDYSEAKSIYEKIEDKLKKNNK